jgi:uncharacterized protein HemX
MDSKPTSPATSPYATWLPLALAGAACALAAWTLIDARSNAESLRANVAVKLDEQAAQLKAAAQALEAAQKDIKDAQNRLRELEAGLTEVQGQRVALEEMARELARAPDEWLLAEVEQTLNIASRELTLAGNVRAALAALQSIDTRLARADKLQVLNLRRALNQDMERLKAVPSIDTQGISVKLDNLMGLAATLPLAVSDGLTTEAREPAAAGRQEAWLARLAGDFWNEARQLVRIRRVGADDPVLIAPKESYFLRENLKLRLLSARTALMARDEVNYKEDLKIAREMLTRYFDPKARVVANAQQTLKQLAENPVSIATPDITASLNVIRAIRAARERAGR